MITEDYIHDLVRAASSAAPAPTDPQLRAVLGHVGGLQSQVRGAILAKLQAAAEAPDLSQSLRPLVEQALAQVEAMAAT
ncbi:MAG: hypothetical protein J0I28_08780 [Caulobacterales bacterium]|nr:hypothetical protein [Caulobacterales bacterium]